MEEVYNLHQHTNCVIIHIGKSEMYIEVYDTLDRRLSKRIVYLREKACISYNEQKSNISSWGNEVEENKDTMNDFMTKLYQVYTKENWDEQDGFLIKAISDYLYFAITEIISDSKMENKTLDTFHYAFIVPSEWEEGIREDFIRPVFIRADLIRQDDHEDRLLFITDIESIFFKSRKSFKRGDKIISCRISPMDMNTALIKLDLVITSNTLFDFPNSMLFPKVMRSKSLFITCDDIKNRIKVLLKDKVFSNCNDQEEIIEDMIEEIYSSVNAERNWYDKYYGQEEDEYNKTKLLKPIFTNTSKWNLNNFQEKTLKSIQYFHICKEIGKTLITDMKEILSNNYIKKYKLLITEDNYFSEINLDVPLLIWLQYILEYNKQVLNNVTTLTTINMDDRKIRQDGIIFGVKSAVKEVIQNSDMYCHPLIMPNSDHSSSVFLNSGPNVIINIDILYRCTSLSYSILNEDGSIDHSYFTAEKCLPSLDCFYELTSVTTLKIKDYFILFADNYLLGDFTHTSINQEILFKIESMLNKDCIDKEILMSAQHPKYIKSFFLMYLIHVKELISSKLPIHARPKSDDLKIGYAISIEQTVLDKIIGNKENLRELIYKSGLLEKNDEFKKLRIITQGEGILSIIQQTFKLKFPVKSYFVLAQLHEDYIYLTLNQVVTDSSSEDQEAIIIEDETILIENVYDSLYLNMWENLILDQNLIQLCQIHNEQIFKLFSLNTKVEFMTNFKQYISNNIFNYNPNFRNFNHHTIILKESCNCKINLTIDDIIEISLKPVLNNISTTILASLINDNIFGKYPNIKYQFNLIHFNQNPHFQKIITIILDEEADNFKPQQGIETLCMVIPNQPISKPQSFLYKGFKTGTLYQTFNENYGFTINSFNTYGESSVIYKLQRTNTKSILVNKNIGFPLLLKKDIIRDTKENCVFYLENPDYGSKSVYIEIYKYDALTTKDTRKTIQGFNFGTAFDEYLNNSLSIMITIKSLGYSSSFQFSVKQVGQDTESSKIVELGEPMVLYRL